MKFCSQCGHPMQRRIPDGDHFEREVCDHCGYIQYYNPKVIVGCIPVWQQRIVMCRRSIEPRLGYWTFPAGFMELHETAAEGAAREAAEESGVPVTVDDLLAVIDLPHVGQIYMLYRGRAQSAAVHPTDETSEVRLMTEAEIPWDRIAFPTISHGLKFFFADRAAGHYSIHTLNLRGATLHSDAA
ncbi:MAG TPA: NUDIX hydrolase [Nevskiaceae bacterium]|nr:NUDIX hydrolase [Nevskiaceae bacterium]